jgi:hypothetical protein
MLIPKKLADGRTRHSLKTLLVSPQQGYIRPRIDFTTSTSIWHVDEIIKKRVTDWRRLTEEDGHNGERNVLRKDGVYTGTYSVFPIPLMEYILVRYAENGGKLLDAFAGGPPRGICSSIMGLEYHGVDVRQEQIDENHRVLKKLNIPNINYHLNDARTLDFGVSDFDVAVTCPPYYDLEVYSDDPSDISSFPTYASFNAAMWMCAEAHRPLMKPGAFVCIIIGNFRNKKTGEMIDFRADTVANFKEAGFLFWDEIILSRNFGSAAQRAKNAWAGKKLVRRHEFLLVFRTPQ